MQTGSLGKALFSRAASLRNALISQSRLPFSVTCGFTRSVMSESAIPFGATTLASSWKRVSVASAPPVLRVTSCSTPSTATTTNPRNLAHSSDFPRTRCATMSVIAPCIWAVPPRRSRLQHVSLQGTVSSSPSGQSSTPCPERRRTLSAKRPSLRSQSILFRDALRRNIPASAVHTMVSLS